MVSINKKMYNRSILYGLLMVLFGVLAYLFFNSGFNTKTIVKVDYENNSDVYYKVSYLDNDYSADKGKYIANVVDYIDINYEYNNILSEYVSGYYKYNVDSYLIAYEEDITNSLWKREYKLVNDKIELLDENNINSINIADNFRVDYKKYRDEILDFIDNYDINISGYLHIRINILEFLNFGGLESEYADNKVITINIPLTDKIFKINVNDIDDTDSYYEFSNSVPMNIVFLIIGVFCFSISLSLFIMVIRQFILIYERETNYNRELKRILSKYDDVIVRVKKFYVSKKYNMIYVDSFRELLDVHNKNDKMISFKEVKRNSESVFFIVEGDNVWIYKLISNNIN